MYTTYNEIYETVLNTHLQMGVQEEGIWTEELCYETNYPHVENTCGEFYSIDVSDYPGGQCFHGELGTVVNNRIINELTLANPMLVGFWNTIMTGRIHYYPVVTALCLLEIITNGTATTISERQVHDTVEYIVAHERRHSVQPASLLDPRTWDGMRPGSPEYRALSHEMHLHLLKQ